MDHRDAIEQLPYYLSGELAESQLDELQGHIESCEECRRWVDDYRLFAAVLHSDPGHPPAEQLAREAVETETSIAAEDPSLRKHLETCPDCRQQLSLTEEAVARARSRHGSVKRFHGRSPFGGQGHRRLAIAASLALVSVLAFTFRGSFTQSPGGSVGDNRVLSTENLEGTQVLDAAESITATDVTVESGSEVAFRAGDTVALGDGFTVASGASFKIEIVSAGNQEDSEST